VRQNEAGGSYPGGVGVSFVRMPLSDRFWLRVGLPEVTAV